MRKQKRTKTTKSKKSPRVQSKTNRDFGTPPDKELGRYLKSRGLSALAEILKID